MKKNISHGIIHKTPPDLEKMIISFTEIFNIWEDLTPIARNEWICWIDSAKKISTRKIRIEKMHSKIMQGFRRPCCWAGCTHRQKETK